MFWCCKPSKQWSKRLPSTGETDQTRITGWINGCLALFTVPCANRRKGMAFTEMEVKVLQVPTPIFQQPGAGNEP